MRLVEVFDVELYNVAEFFTGFVIVNWNGGMKV
jgi:hypothetical protein